MVEGNCKNSQKFAHPNKMKSHRRTRKHCGGYSGQGYNRNAARNQFAWQTNPMAPAVGTKPYKTTAENEAFAAQQNAFWSGRNGNGHSNYWRSYASTPAQGNTYVPRAPRQVPTLYTGVNYEEEAPAATGPSFMNRVRGFFGRGTRNAPRANTPPTNAPRANAAVNAARNNTRRNNGRFTGIGKATRRLKLNNNNRRGSNTSTASTVSAASSVTA